MGLNSISLIRRVERTQRCINRAKHVKQQSKREDSRPGLHSCQGARPPKKSTLLNWRNELLLFKPPRLARFAVDALVN